MSPCGKDSSNFHNRNCCTTVCVQTTTFCVQARNSLCAGSQQFVCRLTTVCVQAHNSFCAQQLNSSTVGQDMRSAWQAGNSRPGYAVGMAGRQQSARICSRHGRQATVQLFNNCLTVPVSNCFSRVISIVVEMKSTPAIVPMAKPRNGPARQPRRYHFFNPEHFLLQISTQAHFCCSYSDTPNHSRRFNVRPLLAFV